MRKASRTGPRLTSSDSEICSSRRCWPGDSSELSMASRSRSATTSPSDVRTAGPVSSGPLAAGSLAEADHGLLKLLSTYQNPRGLPVPGPRIGPGPQASVTDDCKRQTLGCRCVAPGYNEARRGFGTLGTAAEAGPPVRAYTAIKRADYGR